MNLPPNDLYNSVLLLKKISLMTAIVYKLVIVKYKKSPYTVVLLISEYSLKKAYREN